MGKHYNRDKKKKARQENKKKQKEEKRSFFVPNEEAIMKNKEGLSKCCEEAEDFNSEDVYSQIYTT